MAVTDDEPSAPRSGRRQLREPVSRRRRCQALPPSTSFRSRNSAPPGARPTAASRAWCTGRNDRARAGRSSNNWRASMSYVEGKHSMKFGYQGGYLMDDRFPYTNSQFMTFRMNNGRPDQINEIIDYNLIQQRVRYDAYYAQDQWTMGRITLQGALRFDRATSIFPEADDRRRPLPADGHVVPGNQGRRCVQGPDAARRRRDRSLRRRQDGAEVQLRPLPRGGAERRPLHRQPSDVADLDDGVAHVDRCERQLQARLRPVEQRGAGLRRAAAISAAPSRTPTSASRSSTRRRIRRCSTAGASGPATGSGARRFSGRWCRECRSSSATSAAGC